MGKRQHWGNTQLTFDILDTSHQPCTVKDTVVYKALHRRRATFEGCLSAKVHRWFRLTPSFGPELVCKMLDALDCADNEYVLDPFAGAATTPIECQLNGLCCYGFEINPLLYFVGDTSLNWDIKPKVIIKSVEMVKNAFEDLDKKVSFESLEANGLHLPPIYNPTRWWRPDILKQLCILTHSIDKLCSTSEVKDFLRLALAGVLVPDLTNVTLGRLQLHFIERAEDDINVLRSFLSQISLMLDDLEALRSRNLKKTSKIFLTDATEISTLQLSKPVNCVITSPPYPNRYSYVWNTRPHLYLLGFMSVAKEASDLDKRTIGGTWGTATSTLKKGQIEPEFSIIKDVVEPICEEIRQSDNLMANYVMKYFNLLSKQVVEMEKILADNARLAYVVGCSRIKGVYVETDVLLAKIIEGLGLNYKIRAVERIRRRNSGKDLHESIVYAWKNR